MVDWLEQQFEALIERTHVGLLSRMHPEIERIGDDRDQLWAWWYAVAGLPAWKRLIFGFTQRRAVRLRYLFAMRIRGHDVCPCCGYDMRGHKASVGQTRRCPECGEGVPGAQAQARSVRHAA